MGHEDVVKHVRATLVDGEWVDGRAFLPRPSDVDGSSVHRMRVFSKIDEAAILQIRKISRLTLKHNQRFAQINLENLRIAVEDHCALKVKADPLAKDGPYPEDKSHALVIGFPSPSLLDNILGDLIRRKIKKVYPAVVD